MADTEVYYGTGRRKRAIARVWLKPGQGQIKINNRGFEEYFPREVLRILVQQPIESASVQGRYDVRATVTGGGSTGQAEAVRHGIARALVKVKTDYKKRLRRAGFMTRDPRMVERKKYGLKKARRAPQWAKR